MKHLLPLLLGLMVLVQSCTGQKPAELKNSTTPRHAVKASCSSMVFEGQVLSKKNILNIFDCSGWAKKYPDLNLSIKNADDSSINNGLKIFNDTFFSTKAKRKAFFEIVANAESRGEMRVLATIMEKGLANHKIIAQVNKALHADQMNLTEKTNFMKVLSGSNEENLKVIRAVKKLSQAYETGKSEINDILTEEDKEKLVERVAGLLDDLSNNMDSKDWTHLSRVIYDNDSPLQNWAIRGLKGNVKVLLDIMEEKDFYADVTFLKNSLNTGVRCTNRGSSQDFNINVGQDLKHKIEGLKTENKETFEKLLLHGLNKYLAFQAFCEENERKQGINSFYMVLKHAFSVLPSSHDFNFLKRIHQIFDQDRFVFLSLLSSKSFSSLRNVMIDLKADGRDAKLVKSLYGILATVPADELITISGLINEISLDDSKVNNWHHSWSKLWDGLSPQEKNDFIDFLGVFLGEDVQASGAVNFLETVLVAFPELSGGLAENLTDENFQKNIRHIVSLLADNEVQNQLSDFLSNKGLFEFIEIMTQEYVAPARSVQHLEQNSTPSDNYVEVPQSDDSVKVRQCFALLTETYDHDSSYYNLVNSLPRPCLETLGQVGFVGNIYLWMNASNNYFINEKQVYGFHSATSVWSPGMLQFIFSSAVKADFALRSNDGKKGIKDNLVEIHRVVTDPRFLKAFHEFSLFYTRTDLLLGLDSRLMDFMESHDDPFLNQLTTDGLKLMEKADPYVDLVIKPNTCNKISANLGANPCLSNTELYDGFLQILRVLKRKNERDDSLIKELVTWLHPAGGIKLPFRKTKTRAHQASIDEIIRFLYDLSSENTVERFVYKTEFQSENVEGDVLSRLEVVIRDIAFINNFYGAHFKNMVAGAKDYRNDVIDAEKLLKMLDSTGGLFRSTHTFPEDTKYRLKNVRQTYKSLVDLSDTYVQADGTTRSYGPFIQSLLAAVGESSKLSTQKFNPYRIPNERVVEGHNGIFLTKVVEMSGLRHLASFVRARFDSKLSALQTDDFKMVNKNLLGRHQDLEKVKNAIQSVLDKYLDNDQDQLNKILEDGINYITALDSTEQKAFEEIAVKGLTLLSNEKISTVNVEKLAELAEVAIEMWPKIKILFDHVDNKKEILNLMNKMLDHLVRNPEELNRIVTALESSKLITAEDLRSLLNDKIFLFRAASFVNQLVEMRDFESDLNWVETFKKMFSPKDTQWEGLKTSFQRGLDANDKKLTLSLLISVLGEKDKDGYRLERVMDELFKNHRADLIQFLEETFKALEFKPD